MNKAFKVGILLVILAVPAFIFVFLHSFGRNYFDTDTFYSEGVDTLLVDCEVKHPTKYRVNDPTFSSDSINVYLLNSDPVINSSLTSSWISWFEAFDELPVSFKQVIVDETCNQNEYSIDNILCLSQSQIDKLYCNLIVNKEAVTGPYGVLINEDKVIKGYFNLSESKEIDRLFAEIQILLTNYE
ncbi:hypothetical protein [Marinigracilibium pacificum]|uniref:Uncharacterized protein n=1 Tax=Marinigracilibium pacificum TaxID=2729599 RepID=A0A848J3S7_9BACT|nr:hypothetical protein [Marinigracilibium pacificum]NMM50165.1 hypothetical protein [Marinigracilibium pacificum]